MSLHSRNALSQWCSLVYSHLEDETLNQQFSQKINHGVIGAVGKCIEAEKDIVLKKTGAFISATPQNQYLNSYGVTLTMRPPLPNEKNKILSIEPKEVSCEIAGTPITATPNNPYIVKTNEVVMTCYKNGATPAQIAINTYPTNSTPWIVLPGTRDDSELTEIRQRQQALFQTIRNIRSLGDQRWTALANWSAQPQTVISGSRGSGMVSCPNGYYVAAIQVIDTDNGGACVECISVFKAECRPLNVK
ncbi:hypothetical protein [Azotobacter chroococcum]|uniref:hypothetical protein n=1 Tax=Azotobacter chroococcum TaxID=353 RepID=UPI0010AE2F7D|nr:hypothetical protein [Azotobacter chroococcum]TKD44684.1 hypothetical protein FCG41_05765 [Azotobacter chroococcum]